MGLGVHLPPRGAELCNGAADLGGKDLAQLHAPLVERVDAPDKALHSRAVLVEGEKLPDGEGRELREHEAEGGPVAREGLVRDKLGKHPLGRELLGGLAVRQGVGLREEVAHELVVVGDPLSCQLHGLLGGHGGDKVARDDAALVDELVEGVLPVCPRLPEVDLASGGRQRGPVERHALAVALHRQLLDVGGELPEGLLVGQDCVRGVAEEGRVPDGDEPHEHREVLGCRGRPEVAVHVPHALEEALHDGEAVLEGQGQHPHGRGDRVAAPDPLPEAKHVVLGVDPELGDQLGVGADGDHVLGDRGASELGGDPGADAAGVEHRLGGREGL